MLEELFSFLLHPAGQQRDLEGRTDLLAQARRREYERLIAVRLQHDEVIGHGHHLDCLSYCVMRAVLVGKGRHLPNGLIGV